jgi:hypothetical protein
VKLWSAVPPRRAACRAKYVVCQPRGCDGSLGGARGEAARIGHEMWPSRGKFHSRDRARSAREGEGRIGHNVAFGRPPQMPQFEENNPSTEIPRLAYCDTARPRPPPRRAITNTMRSLVLLKRPRPTPRGIGATFITPPPAAPSAPTSSSLSAARPTPAASPPRTPMTPWTGPPARATRTATRP